MTMENMEHTSKQLKNKIHRLNLWVNLSILTIPRNQIDIRSGKKMRIIKLLGQENLRKERIMHYKA